jgi:hypothetical protein
MMIESAGSDKQNCRKADTNNKSRMQIPCEQCNRTEKRENSQNNKSNGNNDTGTKRSFFNTTRK